MRTGDRPTSSCLRAARAGGEVADAVEGVERHLVGSWCTELIQPTFDTAAQVAEVAVHYQINPLDNPVDPVGCYSRALGELRMEAICNKENACFANQFAID